MCTIPHVDMLKFTDWLKWSSASFAQAVNSAVASKLRDFRKMVLSRGLVRDFCIAARWLRDLKIAAWLEDTSVSLCRDQDSICLF